MPLVLYFGHNFPAYILGAVLLGTGGAFISGSLEAMVYDHPSVSKKVYRQIVWLEITFYQTGLISSALLGGFLYQLNHSLPFIGEAVASLLCVMFIFQMHELRAEKQANTTESNSRFFLSGLRFLLQNGYLRVLVATAVVLQVMVSASIEFINEASMIGYGIKPEARGLLIAGSKVIALLVLNLVLLKLLHRDKAKLVFIAAMSSAIFLLMNVHALVAFLAGFLIFNWISATQQSFLNAMIQDHLPSSHRATAMSGLSALTGLLALGANLLFGWMIQHYHRATAPYALFLTVCVLLVAPCIFWLVKHTAAKSQAPEDVTPITPTTMPV